MLDMLLCFVFLCWLSISILFIIGIIGRNHEEND